MTRGLSLGDIAAGTLLYGLAALALVLLVGPSVVVVLISFTEKAYISFPPEGFSLQWYADLVGREQIIDAARTSLEVATGVTALCLVLGVPAAHSLVRGRYPGRTALSALMVAPQMMPGMVIGIAVLFFGAYFGFYQSTGMLILSLAVFCLPFVVRLVMARLAGIDPGLEEASMNLGAGRVQTFARITLPQLAGATVGAAAFVFIEAFDNLTVALFTASPRARPLAVELYNLVQFDSSPMVAALSAVEIVLALLVLAVVARTLGLERVGR